ncbi:beta-defensin 121 [Choloepus didactylus]|uniref:beta-defensin 121 n=1 Tax=Choloepus didactylus TaxID=27675 RepID=UPI0001F9F6E0|nr:beta-defensin 121 [Choloepus didactylus]
MKLLLLVWTVSLLLAQVTPDKKCWAKSGRCRETCKDNEVFHILCKAVTKCCVQPKYVPFNIASSDTAGSQKSTITA